MPSKNLILCCDGTNNQFNGDHTNVIRMYKVAAYLPGRQLCFYDPGVGTMPSPYLFTQLGKRLSMLWGLLGGGGFLDNVSDAYRYLMLNYEEGDQVYLFGFSRGAYTARALAGLLYSVGLLYNGTENLLPYALNYWRTVYTPTGKGVCAEFKTSLARRCPIHFLGVWDTVGSVGVVNHFKTFPFTRHNPEIDIVRHAVSIDERRCFFRDNLMEKSWDNPAQDVKNVWFPGVHSDVGGGYPAQEAGLAMGAFEWMLREAIAAQLLVDDAALAAVRAATVPPDASGELHKSLHGGWWLAEFIPKRVWSPQKKGHVWQWKPNLPRSIADGSTLHATYLARLKAVNGYRPVNLPHDEPVVRARFAIEP